MIDILLHNKQHIKIKCIDNDYYDKLKDYFSFKVPGYYFTSKFKNSSWDGKISFFNKKDKTMPYGLFFDFLKFHKKYYPDEKFNVSSEIKKLFSIETPFNVMYNLKHYPRDYQDDCIKAALKYKKCILHVSVASGKSLIIAYIIKTLMEHDIFNHLIIVPTINLVEQFKNDLLDYGIKNNIGLYYNKTKEPFEDIVISTWQSLQNRHNILSRFNSVFVDECHTTGGSIEIRKILKNITAEYKIGVTGTLPSKKLHLFNIKSYLGPIVRKYKSSELAEKGHVSKCEVIVYPLKYPNKKFSNIDYFTIRENIFKHKLTFMLNIINDVVSKQDNILILLNLVEKEGKILEDFLKFHEINVVFIYGKTDVSKREYHRKEMDRKQGKVIIATYPIFKLGVNIPSLKHILFASPMESEVSVLQSIGRVLRKHIEKVDGAYIHDLLDDVPFLYTHGENRQGYYKKEKFETIIKDATNITGE